jgi:hypothetical protein
MQSTSLNEAWSSGSGTFGVLDPGSFSTWNFSSELTVQQLEVRIQPSTDLLNKNIVNLISSIEALTERINALELCLQEIGSPINEIRRVDDEQARREIKELFDTKHGETIFPSEVAEELHLDYDTVTRLLSDLENEGQIKSVSASGT